MPAARQAKLQERACQRTCPTSSCPQTLSGLESLFLLQWLQLNTTGRFTKEDGEGDKALVTPLGTAGFPALNPSQWHFLLRSGISDPCSLPGSRRAAACHPAALLVMRCQKRAMLPTGDFTLEQEG